MFNEIKYTMEWNGIPVYKRGSFISMIADMFKALFKGSYDFRGIREIVSIDH